MRTISFVIALLLSSMAFASVDVRDRANVIPQAQEDALVSSSSRWPFDLHVLTGTFASPAALESAVHRCVTGPNVVCIGIDPAHHKTTVHFGTALGVPTSGFPVIASAGNSYFRNGDYQGGIEAIASRTRDFVRSVPMTPPVATPSYTVQQPVQVHIDNPNTSAGWWVFAILMGIIGIGCIWAIARARKTVKKINDDMNDFRDEAFEMSARNIEQQDFHEKLKTKMVTTKTTATAPVTTPTATVAPARTITPAPTGSGGTTVVHNHISGGNSGPSTSDVLLAYELGRISNPTPVVVTPTPVVERVIEREVVRNDDGGSSSSWGSSSRDDDNDSGGSSSSWDSSSSSSDSSSSSWDSGGDSGGGSDGGGGGSDW